MHPNYLLPPLAAGLALFLAGPVKAATPMPLNHMDMVSVKQTFQFVDAQSKTLLPINANALSLIKAHQDKNHVKHSRFQQFFRGFKVFGGYAIVHGNNQSLNGTVYNDLSKDLGATPNNYVKNATAALSHFTAQFKDGVQTNPSVEPMVYIDKQHQAHWAYRVSVKITTTTAIPSQPTAIIDATTHKPFVSWNNIKTAKSTVNIMGFGGNEKTGLFGYGKVKGDVEVQLPYIKATRDNAKKMCFMETDDVKVIDMKHKQTSPKTAMKFACKKAVGNDNAYMSGYKANGYDKVNGAFSPSNDAMYSGYVIKHLYKDWYDLEALVDSDGEPMQLVMRVHYGYSYENAFWDGEQMTFGDGESMMYPLVSLGVGAHEISHGFTEQNSGLEYYAQSGGMNESFSDMAAMAAEYYSVGESSWMIGSEIMKEDSGYEALRFMDQPSKDGSSIDTADEYYDGLDVHHSSGVYNHLFYLMSTKEGWNTRKAFDVMVKANQDYWTPTSTFAEAACGVISATGDLGYEVKDVLDALSEVAIDTSACLIPIPTSHK